MCFGVDTWLEDWAFALWALAFCDKAGSLPFACAIDTQVLSPRKMRRNPAFSSKILPPTYFCIKHFLTLLAQLLESFVVCLKAQILPPTYFCIKHFFRHCEPCDSKAWQSTNPRKWILRQSILLPQNLWIATRTSPLAMTAKTPLVKKWILAIMPLCHRKPTQPPLRHCEPMKSAWQSKAQPQLL